MTWKTYAAVSGATVLAGWLASSPPSNTPAPAAPSRRQPARSNTASPAELDIEQQADRLQARLREETAYREPDRNPFQFGARERPRPAASARAADVQVPRVDAVPLAPPPPPISLSGIAEDRAGARTQRTAILSSPQGVLLVREGDEVLGLYRVSRIEADAVELVSLSGAPPLRLSLRTPNSQ